MNVCTNDCTLSCWQSAHMGITGSQYDNKALGLVVHYSVSGLAMVDRKVPDEICCCAAAQENLDLQWELKKKAVREVGLSIASWWR